LREEGLEVVVVDFRQRVQLAIAAVHHRVVAHHCRRSLLW
jgi:hypothetical protein